MAGGRASILCPSLETLSFYFRASEAKGCCENRANCGYCYLPHGERAPKLDKRQRLVLQSLPENVLLDMLQRAVRGRAEPLDSL